MANQFGYVTGQLYYNAASGALDVWNGTAFVAVSAGAGGTAGGDLSGTYPNPTVVNANGFPIAIVQLAPTVVVVGTTTTNITFSSIPAGFSSLNIKLFGQTNAAGAADQVQMQFNGDTGAHYSYSLLFGGNTTTPAASVTNGASFAIAGGFSGVFASVGGQADITIPGYAATVFDKTFQSISSRSNSASGAYDNFVISGGWLNNAAITSIKLYPGTGTDFVAGTTCTLYGIL